MNGLTLQSFFHLSFSFSVVDYSITLHILGKRTLVATRARHGCVVFFLLIIFFSISSKSVHLDSEEWLLKVVGYWPKSFWQFCHFMFLFFCFCFLFFNDRSLFVCLVSVKDCSFTNDFTSGWSRYQPWPPPNYALSPPCWQLPPQMFILLQ